MSQMLTCGCLNPFPTAIFCGSDAIASGVIEVLSTHGLRVPEDISVAGFDDLLTARMTLPPLTTVRQPFRELGKRAVERLLPQIGIEADAWESAAHLISMDKEDAAAVSSSRNEIFPVELIVRGSVGPPREQPIRPPYVPTI